MVVIFTDGHCKVYEVLNVEPDCSRDTSSSSIKDPLASETEDPNSSSGSNISSTESIKAHLLNAIYEQRLPPNVKKVEIADVNGDGLNELIVTLTDRVLRTYVWQPGPDPDPALMEANAAEDSVPESPKDEALDEEESEENQEDNVSLTPEPPAYVMVGELASLSKWEFGNQVGGFAICHRDGEPRLLVSQKYGILMKPKDAEHFQITELIPATEEKLDASPEIVSSESSVIIANCKGNVRRVLDTGQILWSLNFDQHLFGLAKFDLNLDGKDEAIVSTWAGQVVHLKRIIYYYLESQLNLPLSPTSSTWRRARPPSFIWTRKFVGSPAALSA